MSDKKDLMWRAYLVYIGFFIALIVVIVKTIMIQSEGSASLFTATKEKIPTRTAEKKPRRGEVLDRNYTTLSTSVSFFDIHMDPTVVDQEVFDKELGALCAGLSKIFPETSARDFENYIRKGRADGRRFVKIKLRATYEQRRRSRKLPIFNLGRNKGGLIDTDEVFVSKRPHGGILSRTLGGVRRKNGKNVYVGLEGAFDKILAGEPGEEVEQKLSSGWKKTGKMIREPIEGADLITSFDMEIQEVAHSELYRQLKNQGAKSGCVIVMDVKTGFVRAMANLEMNENGDYSEGYNHAIGTKEVPGSTFKLASLMAALEDKKISLDDTVNAVGEYHFYDSKLKDSNPYGYGRITIRRAFELSSNVISRVINNAYRKDPEVFIDRLRSFGIGDTLGVAIKGEPLPTLPAPGTRNWSGISLPWMSIGYEVRQTPLQTLAFYNAVANNGVLVRPQFVEHIRRGQRIVKSYKPVVLRPKICSDKTLRLMQECLKGVVKRGTGSALKSALFDIAGKTGTAVVQNADGHYGEEGNKTYQASFVGYFPADEPLYSCIVVVAAPSKDIYGATVSGTVFSAIANKVYSNSLNYHKAINEEEKRSKEAPLIKDGNIADLLVVLKRLHLPYQMDAYSEWSRVRTSESHISIVPRKISSTTVPNVSGLTAKDAVYLIEHLGMHVYVRGSGRVVKQTIPAGSPVVAGGLMEIVLE